MESLKPTCKFLAQYILRAMLDLKVKNLSDWVLMRT